MAGRADYGQDSIVSIDVQILAPTTYYRGVAMTKRSNSQHLNVQLKHTAKAWQYNYDSKEWLFKQLSVNNIDYQNDAGGKEVFVEVSTVFDGDYIIQFYDGTIETLSEEEFTSRFVTS